jgi:hypothetical protein
MKQACLIVLLCVTTTVIYGQRTISRGVYSIPGTSFYPDLNLGYSNGNAADGNAYADGGTASRLTASVQLPHGATVDSVRLYVLDYSPAVDMYISLASYAHAGGGLKEIFTNTTDGSSSTIRSQKALLGSYIVDNDKNGYYVLVQPKGGAWPSGGNKIAIRSVVFYYH